MTQTVKLVMRHGKPTLTTSGFEGDECLNATRGVEDLLSGEGGVEIREMEVTEEEQNEAYN